MLRRGFTSLLLDLDGTLVDSEPKHVVAHREFLLTQGIAASEEVLFGNIGKGDREFFTALAGSQGRQIDAAEWCRQKTEILMGIYRREPLPMRPGVIALLDEAVAIGLRICVVTSSERELADQALRSSGLAWRLPMRVCYEDTEAHKPDPAPYRLAILKLGVQPKECLAIEDSVSGVSAATAAGAHVIGFAGLMSAEQLLNAGAHRVVHDLTEVL